MNSALSIAGNKGFQNNFQKIKDYAYSEAVSSSTDQGSRENKSFVHSLDELHSKQLIYQSAQSHLDQISKNES